MRVVLSTSNRGEEGATVLDRAQIHTLGEALEKIRDFFAPVYGRHRLVGDGRRVQVRRSRR